MRKGVFAFGSLIALLFMQLTIGQGFLVASTALTGGAALCFGLAGLVWSTGFGLMNPALGFAVGL